MVGRLLRHRPHFLFWVDNDIFFLFKEIKPDIELKNMFVFYCRGGLSPAAFYAYNICFRRHQGTALQAISYISYNSMTRYLSQSVGRGFISRRKRTAKTKRNSNTPCSHKHKPSPAEKGDRLRWMRKSPFSLFKPCSPHQSLSRQLPPGGSLWVRANIACCHILRTTDGLPYGRGLNVRILTNGRMPECRAI